MRRQAVSHSYGIACTSWPSGRGGRRACALPAAARHVITIDERTMIAMQMTSPDVSRRQTPGRPTAAIQQDRERSGILPPGQPATVAAQFQPLDPGVVSEAIPAFFIGRNKEGFWIARDAKGLIGGIFLLENSALSFAKRHSQPGGCATIFPCHRFELDLENNGNPLALQLESLMRLRRRAAAFVGKMTEAVKRRLEDFHVL
jgi:hypothetical protein